MIDKYAYVCSKGYEDYLVKNVEGDYLFENADSNQLSNEWEWSNYHMTMDIDEIEFYSQNNNCNIVARTVIIFNSNKAWDKEKAVEIYDTIISFNMKKLPISRFISVYNDIYDTEEKLVYNNELSKPGENGCVVYSPKDLDMKRDSGKSRDIMYTIYRPDLRYELPEEYNEDDVILMKTEYIKDYTGSLVKVICYTEYIIRDGSVTVGRTFDPDTGTKPIIAYSEAEYIVGHKSDGFNFEYIAALFERVVYYYSNDEANFSDAVDAAISDIFPKYFSVDTKCPPTIPTFNFKINTVERYKQYMNWRLEESY